MKLIKFNSLNNKDYIDEINLITKGQCVYLFESVNECKFQIVNLNNDDGIEVQFLNNKIVVIKISDKEIYEDIKNNKGIINLSGVYYWFSLDAQNQIFYAGIGEARIENIAYSYKFSFTKDKDDLRKINKKFLESLCKIKTNYTKPIRLLKYPIINRIPLLVLDKNELTMDNIAKSEVMPISNLSSTSQKLYNCISGKNFVLDTPDFPEFTKAIEMSIITPGFWCYEKLKEKSTEFNKDKPNILETYLRITLGDNNGESPGIPYVMEIWPPNHYSPIHSHAGAEAIIRVLYGQINVSLYPFLCGQKDGIEPFAIADFFKNNITWVSPNLNQTHQLKNINPMQSCITIQCYMYDDDNNVHYDYFDYINNNGEINKYEPDSDMDFIEFKNLMKKEWTDIIKKEFIKKKKK
jgi:hypothetical protein